MEKTQSMSIFKRLKLCLGLLGETYVDDVRLKLRLYDEVGLPDRTLDTWKKPDASPRIDGIRVLRTFMKARGFPREWMDFGIFGDEPEPTATDARNLKEPLLEAQAKRILREGDRRVGRFALKSATKNP